MANAKKIEIIINSREVPRITKIIDSAGISGYTILPDVQGKGLHGIHSGDELTGVFKNSMIITVCKKETADKLIESLKVFMQKHGGACMVSDIEWVKP
jgi:nitrogen regulatory protein PII